MYVSHGPPHGHPGIWQLLGQLETNTTNTLGVADCMAPKRNCSWTRKSWWKPSFRCSNGAHSQLQCWSPGYGPLAQALTRYRQWLFGLCDSRVRTVAQMVKDKAKPGHLCMLRHAKLRTDEKRESSRGQLPTRGKSGDCSGGCLCWSSTAAVFAGGGCRRQCSRCAVTRQRGRSALAAAADCGGGSSSSGRGCPRGAGTHLGSSGGAEQLSTRGKFVPDQCPDCAVFKQKKATGLSIYFCASNSRNKSSD